MTPTALMGHVRDIARNAGIVLVEGAGGILSPLVEGMDVPELIAALRPYDGDLDAKPIIENGTFQGIEQTQVQLFDIPLAWFIASFFVMSAIAHFCAGWALRSRYEAWLARGMNPLRWVEYSFSSTVMIVAKKPVDNLADWRCSRRLW